MPAHRTSELHGVLSSVLQVTCTWYALRRRYRRRHLLFQCCAQSHAFRSLFHHAMMANPTAHSPQALALSATLTGHTGAVWCVAWSPEGGLLASAGADASVRLWAPPPGALGVGHRLANRGIDRDKGRWDGLDVEAAADADGAEEASAGWTCLFTVGSDVFPRTVRSVAWNPDGQYDRPD